MYLSFVLMSVFRAVDIAGKKNPPLLLQPRPQGLLAFQYGVGKREDPGDEVVTSALKARCKARCGECGIR